MEHLEVLAESRIGHAGQFQNEQWYSYVEQYEFEGQQLWLAEWARQYSARLHTNGQSDIGQIVTAIFIG